MLLALELVFWGPPKYHCQLLCRFSLASKFSTSKKFCLNHTRLFGPCLESTWAQKRLLVVAPIFEGGFFPGFGDVRAIVLGGVRFWHWPREKMLTVVSPRFVDFMLGQPNRLVLTQQPSILPPSGAHGFWEQWRMCPIVVAVHLMTDELTKIVFSPAWG